MYSEPNSCFYSKQKGGEGSFLLSTPLLPNYVVALTLAHQLRKRSLFDEVQIEDVLDRIESVL